MRILFAGLVALLSITGCKFEQVESLSVRSDEDQPALSPPDEAADTSDAAQPAEQEPAEDASDPSTQAEPEAANSPDDKAPENKKKPAPPINVGKVIAGAAELAEKIAEQGPDECRWASEAIEIDGKADEGAWTAASVIDDFQIPWLTENRRPPYTKTKARMLWDEENFYFFVEMEDSDLYADIDEHDGGIWNNDVFELFFKPKEDNPGYYEFEISAAGTKLDMFLPRRNAGGYPRFKSTQEFHIESKVALRGTLNDWNDKDEGWSVEGRIPWTDFEPTGGAPKEDDVWKYALCRYDYSVAFEGPDLSTTAPLSRPNFHLHDDYAPLKFVGPEKTARVWRAPFDERKLWTTSKVVGSPEPPLPYRARKTFNNLEIKQPLGVFPLPGTNDLLVIQHLGHWRGPGRILRIADDEQTAEKEIFLDFDYIAYGIAFHPDFENNGTMFVGCNGPSSSDPKKTTVFRYTVSREPPYNIVPDSQKLIIDWESDGHNGGDLGFGPDGMLYVTAGDGTSDSDTNLTGQDLTNLCATTIRIDVDHPEGDKPYSVPKDNPFLDIEGARPEIWAYGFRNPWRMTFDRRTGHLWVTQNGQDLWEQVYLVRRGENYGWSIMEGGHPFYLGRKRGPTPIIPPVVDHSHSEARSLTGGIVYYGEKLPDLIGAYIYGDWSTGKIWGLRHDGEQLTWHQELADTTLQIGGFGTDHAGEMFVVDQGGGLYRLEPTPQEVAQAEFPRKLSESGLFADVSQHQVRPGVIPFSVNAEQWSDGAAAERYFAIPGDGRVDFPAGRGWNLPEGSVVIKTLSLEMEAGDPASRRRIETQMLTKQQGEWQGYSYLWNDEQTDAALVDLQGMDKVFEIQDPAEPEGVRKQSWYFASRTDCMACHSRAANYLLGVTTPQLNTTHDYGPVTAHQLHTLEHLGILRVSWLTHEQEIWGKLVASVRNPLVKAMRQVNLLETEAEKKARLEMEKNTKNKAKKAAPQVWNLPDDVVLLLPGRLEWARRGLLKARARIRGDIQAAGLVTNKLPQPPSEYPKLVDPFDPSAELHARARSYLHANCAHCHINAGGGNAQFEVDFKLDDEQMKLLGIRPRHNTFGLAGAKLVAEGDPYRSVLFYRMAKLGGGRMPRVGSSVVDERGLALIREWIKTLSPEDADGTDPIAKLRQAELATAKKLAAPSAMDERERGQAIDQLLASTSGALVLLEALDADKVDPSLRDDVIARGTSHANLELRDLFERYIPLDKRVKRLGNVIKPEEILAIEGDVERGKNLFHSVASVQCKSCHQIGEGKPLVGPELTLISKKNTPAQLLESILEPSKKIDEKYVTYIVETEQGRLHSGVLVEQTEKEVVLKTAKNELVQIPQDEVAEINRQGKSIMPELLLRDMTAEQVADLLAYLASLR